MNCADWEERVALYAGGDLIPAEEPAVERHVADCAGCKALLSGLRESLGLLREAHAEPLDPAHFAAVRARVFSDLERGRGRSRRQAWAFAMVAALVLLIAEWPRPPKSMVVPMPAAPAAPVARIVRAPVPPAPQRKRVRKMAVKAEEPAERLVVKILTNDPNVVIYWITGSKGE